MKNNPPIQFCNRSLHSLPFFPLSFRPRIIGSYYKSEKKGDMYDLSKHYLILIIQQMQNIQQFDDCFELELNIKKVENIFFLNSKTLLVIHIPYQYTIIQIVDRNQTKVLKQHKFSYLIEEIKVYSNRAILFVHENQLHLFDVYLGESICVYNIQASDIYEQQFRFEKNVSGDENVILFYKTSILKSTPITIYYQLHLLVLSNRFQRIKKMKVEHQEARRFGYCSGQIFSYQTTGFQIQVCFIESGVFQKINSIFNLFLIDVQIGKDEILFDFTHQQLQNELTSYQVSKKRVKRLQKKPKVFETHVYRNQSGSRSLVYKNCFNHHKRDHFSGVFRVKIEQSSKYLFLAQHLLPPEVNNSFKQQILNLLI